MAMSDYNSSTDEKLKGVTSLVDQSEQRKHDWFNIVSLPVVILCNMVHLQDCWNRPNDYDRITLWSLPRKSYSQSWEVLWWVFLLYLLVDSVWLMIRPRCVPSAKPILVHHAMLLAGWSVIFAWEGYESYMSLSLLVEVNTFFLIAKRQAIKSSLRHKLLVLCDHVSWVLVRLIWLPMMALNGLFVWLYVSSKSRRLAILAAEKAVIDARVDVVKLAYTGASDYELRIADNLPRILSMKATHIASFGMHLSYYFNTALYVFLAGILILYQNLLWSKEKYTIVAWVFNLLWRAWHCWLDACYWPFAAVYRCYAWGKARLLIFFGRRITEEKAASCGPGGEASSSVGPAGCLSASSGGNSDVDSDAGADTTVLIGRGGSSGFARNRSRNGTENNL